MDGQSSGGRASGGRGSGGSGQGLRDGDRSGGPGGGYGEREHSGGVRLLPSGSEAVVAAENRNSGPMPGGWFSPSQPFRWRSGASEHDQYFWPQTKGDRAAPPAPTTGSIERISATLGATNLPAVAPSASLDSAYRRMDSFRPVPKTVPRTAADLVVDDLKKGIKRGAAIAADKDKILGDKEENIKLLQGQLAAAMSTIQMQHQALQALATPGGSQVGESSPSMSTGSLDATPGRRRREPAPLPPRPAGPIPSLTPYQRRQLRLTPNKSDDVFGERAITPTPNNTALVTADPPKPLQELLSSCFNKVEAAIRHVPILDLLPRDNGRPTYKQLEIVKLLQGHLDTKSVAFDLLREDEGRIYAITALICHTLVDSIFTEQIIGSKANFSGVAYLAAFEEEQKAAEHGHLHIRDFAYRNALAEQRASAARVIVSSTGFWKWLNSTTYDMTKTIVRDYAVCFPDRVAYTLTQELHKAVREAVRIAVRMRQEPNLIEYHFPPTGTPWHSRFHVHRNFELIGEQLTDESSPYCVRIAIMPLIKSKSFASNTVTAKTIHKAEVFLGDRDELLRQVRKAK